MAIKDCIQRVPRKVFWVTDREYAKTNKGFIKACKEADTEPTKRQASKYRRGQGIAYQNANRS